MKTISTFEAKNKLSEVIALAEQGEPQVITKNGREAAVVISYQEFQRLTAKKESLSDFLLNSPLRGAELNLIRSKDTGRASVDFSSDEDK
ncbi:MAG: type II toxin-antitoxin system Phd/YefM family antitoxin [Acidobacteriota bacterium]|nr:type II toxin-antitoxin system Phd/YefM family antitoxin [Acidobacteriota bacterium]